MKKIILLSLFILFSLNAAICQTGKEFWFVAPQIQGGHGDKPIFLRISAGAVASTVTISQPANASFNGGNPISVSVGANSTQTVDLTSLIGEIENGTPSPDVVEKKGLYISATADISVYYEILGKSNGGTGDIVNSDIFSLKGKNALGTRFYTPFQNQLNNCDFCSLNGLNFTWSAWSGFDIVATQDNTTITINPTQDMTGTGTTVGHVKNVPFTKTLNKGETFSGRAASHTGAGHLSGSLITSNNPIAVTIYDDSMIQNNAIDLGGDQIVPVNVLGTEYIVVKGQLNTGGGGTLGDRAVIVATADNTTISINGIAQPVMNAGQTLNYQVTSTSAYISSTQPVYVLHLSGYGDETATGLLPPIVCTGSQQVNVIRDTDRPFYLNVLVRAGGEGNFTLKNSQTGNTTALPIINFTSVPGTSNNWKAAAISFDDTNVFPPGSVGQVTNSSSFFHLGIINGAATGGFALYGYFSDYGGLVGGSATATPSTICDNATAVLKLTNNVGIIQWQESPDGINAWANVSSGTGSTTSTYTTSNLTAGTYYYKAMLTSSNGCTPAYSNVVTVTVQPVSVGGTVTASADTICQNSSTTLQVNGNTGNVQWQISPNGTNGWTDIAGATTPSFTTSDLSSTSYFKAVITNGVCAPTFSNVITITVSIPSVGGTATGTSICTGSTGQVTVSGHTGSVQWQESNNGTTGWVNVSTGSGGNSSTYTSGVLNATKYYMALIKNGACSQTTSDTAMIFVSLVSDGGTASGSSICTGSTGQVSISGHTGGKIQWQQSSDGTTGWANVSTGSGGTTTTYTSAALTSTIYYRAQVTSGACALALSDTAMIFVSPVSNGGIATGSSICTGSTGQVTVTGHNGTVQWQQSADGASGWINVASGSGGTSATFSSAALTSTTYYSAKIKSGACGEAVSDTTMIFVSPVSDGGIASGTSICTGSTGQVKISGHTGSSIQWEQSNDGLIWSNVAGGAGATSTIYTSPVLNTTTYYRAQVKSGACISSASDTTMIFVSTPAVGGIATTVKSPICLNDSTSINLTGATGGAAIKWQQSSNPTSGWADATGGSGSTSTTYNTPKLTATTYYRALVTNGACPAVASDTAEVIVNPPTVVGTSTAAPSRICYNSTTNVTVSGNPVGDLQWQETATPAIPGSWKNVEDGSGANTTSYTTANLTSKKYYRVVVSSGGCASSTSTVSAVDVDSLTKKGTAISDTICANTFTTIALKGTTSGSTFTWEQSIDKLNWSEVNPANTTSSYTTPVLTQTMYYRAHAQNGVCGVVTSDTVMVKVDAVTKGGTAKSNVTATCKNSSAIINVVDYEGSIEWQESPDSIAWNTIVSATSATYSTGNLNSTTYYRAVVKNGVCSSNLSLPVKVQVDSTTNPGTSKVSDSEICSGEMVVLSLTGYKGNIQWEDSSRTKTWSNVPGAILTPFTTAALTDTIYYRAKVKNGECLSEVSATVQVNVSPPTVKGSVSAINSPLCAGNTAVVKLDNNVGNIQWMQSVDGVSNWTDVTGGTGAKSKTYTTGPLNESLYFKAMVTSFNCPSLMSDSIKVIVNPITIKGTLSADAVIFCESGKANLTLKDNLGRIQWETSPDGLTQWTPTGIKDTLQSYVTPVLDKTTFYRVQVKSGVCPDTHTDLIQISINDSPVGGVTIALPTAICANSTSMVSLSGEQGSFIWEQTTDTLKGSWTNANITTKSFQTPNLLQTTFFRAALTSTAICPTLYSNTATVIVRPYTDINLGNDTLICEATHILLAPKELTNYQWSDGSTKPFLLIVRPGIYGLTAIDKFGCEASGKIVVDECDTLVIPNVFTPNGDPENQFFVIRGNKPNSKLEVYNRWGTSVYNNDKSYDNTWDGAGLSDGVYFYIYQRAEDTKKYSGWVEIIR